MADEVRGAHGAVEEGRLSGRSVVADSGFNERAVIVQVVLDDDVPAVLAPALVRHVVQDICRYEPVGRVGRRADDRDYPLDTVGERLVVSDGEHIAGASQCLEKQTVREAGAAVSELFLSRHGEIVVKIAVALEALENVRAG